MRQFQPNSEVFGVNFIATRATTDSSATIEAVGQSGEWSED